MKKKCRVIPEQEHWILVECYPEDEELLKGEKIVYEKPGWSYTHILVVPSDVKKAEKLLEPRRTARAKRMEAIKVRQTKEAVTSGFIHKDYGICGLCSKITPHKELDKESNEYISNYDFGGTLNTHEYTSNCCDECAKTRLKPNKEVIGRVYA